MKKRKIVLAAAACLLAGAMCTGGAVAYLTDTDTTTNTFTVGEVTIDTIEPNQELREEQGSGLPADRHPHGKRDHC